MDKTPAAYLVLTLTILFLGLYLWFRIRTGGRKSGLTPLAAIAFVLIIAGFFFGEQRNIGYGLMGAGLALAIADLLRKLRKK
ncbi:MAG: hypothetical protein LWW85_07175 [Marinilabiliales bacterium]|nr:hypothetical protein [Marinilabiliales bacterium]